MRLFRPALILAVLGALFGLVVPANTGVFASTAIQAVATSINFTNFQVGDGALLHENWLYTLSQEPAPDGKIHVLKVQASNFSNYLDYSDPTVTVGGKTICIVGGYLFTAEEMGFQGEKIIVN